MKKLFGVLVVMLVVVMLGGTACGDDDDDGGGDEGTSVEAYFDEVVAIADRTNTALDDVQAELSVATYETEEDEVAANQDAVQVIGQTIEAAAVDMANLDAPDEASAEHDQFVADLEAYAQLASEFYEDILVATTVDEVNELANAKGPEVGEAGDAAGESCRALEAVGAESIEGLDLACPGDEA